ncbi:MAG: mannose-1-phosphate guanylyltransferase [Chitinophagales bacterium]|nr:mannose-1-phosphate guanylyltransferase [Chitinophagales bacterium]MCO5280311.1 mannose-1-phosphate guanylyltransferase [Chitinophagales bacterium]OJV26458.1 MAG: mannose-1-phosphate guanylyltransferase [Bacteroidetes bacterium 37-13]HRN93677.1 mannose-1-phosphate guanylyltransferase [Chitinophagales bacterium]HRP39478.1 mannose-1-phosphate guanylyltransferase [Chitinophagales bacterium]
MSHTYVVIMAGGIGSRFWPKSRIAQPKQFLDILNVGKTLLQLTVERLLPLCPVENFYIVTSKMYEKKVMEQLPDLPKENIIKEPVRRNTAPCIAYACDKIVSQDKDANIVIVPSDQLILQNDKFLRIIRKCLAFTAKQEVLVTIGVKPTKPATGYGYIQYLEAVEDEGFHKVKTFTEKPSLEIAQTFLDSGDFLWNSGMFVWKAKTVLKAFHKYLPEVIDAFEDASEVYNTSAEKKFIEKAYSVVTNISIDYGLMEKANNVYTIPADFEWSDIGTWDSLFEVYEKDYLGNAVKGKNVKIYDARNNMIVASNDKLVVLQGIENLCVIDSGDVLLICERSQEQEIKQITVDLKVAGLDKFL